MDRERIRERAGERCEYCRAPERVAGYAFMVDHFVPRSRGGGDDPANLALCCWPCNLFKSDHVEGPDPCEVLLPRSSTLAGKSGPPISAGVTASPGLKESQRRAARR